MPIPPPDDSDRTVPLPAHRGGRPESVPVEDEDATVTVRIDPALMPTVVADRDRSASAGRQTGNRQPPDPPDLDLYRLIGEGGMGQVWLARDRILRRRVAYKRLRAELLDEREIVLRLLTEAQITAQLDHPNVVPLYLLERRDSQPVGYVMKLVEGETLAALLRRERQAVDVGRPSAVGGRDTLIEHFLKVCDAVAFAHDKGVIHRDLKPDNLMIGRFNEVYVMDWGIARVLDQPDMLSGSGEKPVRVDGTLPAKDTAASSWEASAGTPAYMSPEQARGELERLGPRSDLYSLGLILYEIVCLRRAFRKGNSVDTVLEQVSRGRRARILAPSLALPVSAELRAIIGKATCPRPEDRYPDVAALASDLRHYLHGEPVSVLPETLLRRMLRWIGRHRQAALNLFLGMLLAGAVVTGGIWYRHVLDMQQVREQRELTSHYLSLASAQAQTLVQRLTEILGQLEGLAAAAQVALNSGRESDDRLYTNHDFDSPDRQPPNLALSPHYPWGRYAADHPVAILPPEGAIPQEMALLRRLLTLTPLLQSIFLEANGESSEAGITAVQVRQVLNRDHIAIHWLAVALPEGAALGYPGTGGFPADYDARNRPWYRQALPAKGRRVCGDPYPDSNAAFLDISCSVAIYSRIGSLMGVASLDLSLSGEIADLMASAQLPQRRSLLLNDRGEILLQVGEEAASDQELLRTYRDAEVVQAARDGRSGMHEWSDGTRKLWVIHIYLPEFRWTWVSELYAWGEKDSGQRTAWSWREMLPGFSERD